VEKKQFYVNIATGEIARNHVGNNNSFIIHATDEEAILLREQLDKMHNASVRSFFRAHVPITPYSNDADNDEYDDGLIKAYKMLENLGDADTKAHVRELEFLQDVHDEE